MDSGNRNQPKSSSHYRENKVVEQFPPKGRRERMKRQAQALQNQPASLMAARHTGADAGEHMAAGKGRQQLWQYLTYSPHMHWILPLQWQPGFPRHCQGWQSCCAVSQHPRPQSLTLARLGPTLWPQIQQPFRTQTAPNTVTSFTLTQCNH